MLCCQVCDHILKMRFLLAAAGAGVSEADVTINKIETIPIGVYLPSCQTCKVALLEFGLYMVCICM